MPSFNYKAISRSGMAVWGQIEADSEEAARSLLADQGRFVDEITPTAPVTQKSISADEIKTSKRLKLSDRQRCEFLGQLATALGAQLPIIIALETVGKQNPDLRIKQLTRELQEMIKSGKSLSDGLARYRRIFSSLHISLVEIGENAGNLDKAVGQLADLANREMETRNTIMTAALYPVFVLCLGLISVGIVVTWILPQLLGTLATGVEMMPWPTRVLLSVSTFIKTPYGIIIVVVLGVFVLFFKHWKTTRIGKNLWDGFKLTVPVLGNVQRKWTVSRFARTLGTLTHGGISIIESLEIVRNCMGNEILAREVDKVTRKVQFGSSLAEPLGQSGKFPPLLVQIVAVGEQTGQLADLLLNAADAFDKETNLAIQRFMAIFPAILIAILALIIGFIVTATLLPIIEIQTAIPGV